MVALIAWTAGCGRREAAPSATTTAGAPERAAFTTVPVSVAAATDASVASSDTLVWGTGQWRNKIRWETVSEKPRAKAFIVYRSDAPMMPLGPLNANNPLPAAGPGAGRQQYTYYDLDVKPEHTYIYDVRITSDDGSSTSVLPYQVSGKPKPLTEAEQREIQDKGPAFRQSAP